MININDTLLDLNTLYSNFNHHQLMNIIVSLSKAKNLLEETLMELKTINYAANFENITKIKRQLELCNKNIEITGLAIMCHETKIKEKRTLNGNLIELYLN